MGIIYTLRLLQRIINYYNHTQYIDSCFVLNFFKENKTKDKKRFLRITIQHFQLPLHS